MLVLVRVDVSLLKHYPDGLQQREGQHVLRLPHSKATEWRRCEHAPAIGSCQQEAVRAPLQTLLLTLP